MCDNTAYPRDMLDPTVKWVYHEDHPLYCHGSKSFVEKWLEYYDNQITNSPPVNQENHRTRRKRERRNKRNKISNKN